MVDLLLTLQPRTGFNAAKLAYFLLTNKKKWLKVCFLLKICISMVFQSRRRDFYEPKLPHCRLKFIQQIINCRI